ncbi:phosphotransferase [Bifidobacterium sp. SO1]|uniref:phosphotransferase enzyme family protein n=1 Tax=Bifidobacterium sp. SO1 TaxID=2809029 RepID=UPI001BDD6E53|nr:phosphotransferase [Bifidobacterium sp. SO1]MBT1161512.1 phosphotransferase [Bifidobacterium sp. SO1]
MHDFEGYRTLGQPHETIDERKAGDLLARDYGLDGVRLERIATERDDTFAVAVHGERSPRYLLKIEHPAEDYETVLMRARALRMLERRAANVPVTRLVPCLDGGMIARSDTGGPTRWATLTTFVTGHIVSSSPGRPSHALLADIGDRLARIQQVLADERGYEDRLGRILWDVRLLPAIAQDVLPMVDDAAARELIEQAVATYESASGRIDALPQQLCHGDFHPGNITVRDDRPGEIAGIIDFGDMHLMPAVCDLGTALCYLADGALADPLEPCRIALAAYLRANPDFDRGQLPLLMPVMQARAALIVLLPLLAERRSGVSPEHYLFRPESRIARLRLLQSLSAGSRDLFTGV